MERLPYHYRFCMPSVGSVIIHGFDSSHCHFHIPLSNIIYFVVAFAPVIECRNRNDRWFVGKIIQYEAVNNAFVFSVDKCYRVIWQLFKSRYFATYSKVSEFEVTVV